MNKEQMCPFCPLQGIDESEYQPIGNDFFGKPAKIGDVPSCAECAMVAEITDSAAEMLAELKEAQARKRCGCCHKEGKRLYEVADQMLCGDCIAPPR